MKRFSAGLLIMSAILAVAVTAGCREQSSPSNASAAQGAGQLTPEQKFELVVETFRRGIEEVPIGFVLRDASGHSMMTGKNTVSHELIPPSGPEERYRAVITVTSKSRYSIQRSNGEDESDKKTASDQQNGANGEEDISGVQILDRDLAGPAKKGAADQADSPDQVTVARRPNEEVRKYELVYQNGRWVLAPGTELDPETEQSIINAFDRALAAQA